MFQSISTFQSESDYNNYLVTECISFSKTRSQLYDCRLCKTKRNHKMKECKGFCRNKWCQVHEPCPKQFMSRTCQVNVVVEKRRPGRPPKATKALEFEASQIVTRSRKNKLL